MPAAAATTPVKPKIAATIARIKNIQTQLSIALSSRQLLNAVLLPTPSRAAPTTETHDFIGTYAEISGGV